MPEINLSYILTTYNKLQFLKIVLPDLINNRSTDEEIIVIDAGSTDGTIEFIKSLESKGRPDIFISEKDSGEAHGYNKGILLARGRLIKLISDDDAYYYPAIRKCKNFMILYPEIDILASNTAVTYVKNYTDINIISYYEEGFFKWKDGKLENFAFCMTPVMIRRQSLSLTGLFDIKSKIPDFEWTIRVSRYANIAWYSGFPVVNIINDLSSSANSINVFKAWPEEWEKFVKFYGWVPPQKIMRDYPFLPVSLKIKLTRFSLKNILKSAKRKIMVTLFGLAVNAGLKNRKVNTDSAPETNFEPIFQYCRNWLTEKNNNSEFELHLKNS